MSHWGNVTPGLCRISERIPRRIIKEQWDGLFRPIKLKEDAIFACFFNIRYFLHSREYNQAEGMEFFILGLKSDDVKFDVDQSSQKNLPGILEVIFDEYWTLSTHPEYWKQGQYMVMNGNIGFNETVQMWQTQNQERVASCEKGLEKWLHEN